VTLLRDAWQALSQIKAPNQVRLPNVGPGAGLFAGGGTSTSGSRVDHMSTYSSVSWVFGAVSRIAEAVASADWKLYQGRSQSDRREITSHPALTLWESANAFDTRSDFLEMSQQHFELTGESWWVLIRNGRGIPVEMWAVRPDRMSPIKDRSEYLVGYIYQMGAEKIPLERDDVIFLRHPDPMDPYRGQGPIQSLLLDIGSEIEAANFNRSFFRNDASPGGVIETDRTMSDVEFNRLVDRWKTMHQGTSNAGRMAFLERATFKERKYTQRDMQFAQLRQLNRDQILGAYGIPLPMLGVMEAPSRANAEAAEYIFARWTVIPRLNRIKLALNMRLLHLYPDRNLHFDYEDPTPKHRELDLKEATEGYNAGILTLNESRSILGQDELPDGDEVTSPGGSAPFALSVKPTRSQDTPRIVKAPTPLEIAEKAMELAWGRRLSTEVEGLVAYLDEILAKATRRQITTKIELSDVDGYDWNWWVRHSDEVIEELTAAFRASIIAEWPQIELLLADKYAVDYAEARAARILRIDGDLNIVNRTHSRVYTLVAQTIEQGDSLQTLQDTLRNDYTFSQERAVEVSRTETATAQGQGARAAAVAQGWDEKRWVTQGDDVVESECLMNEEAGWIKVSELFPTGAETIPQHPRCRCNVRYRLAPIVEERSVPDCPTCGKRDTVVINREGPGYWCRRCNSTLSL
jgi:HK97 family phage portal protein